MPKEKKKYCKVSRDLTYKGKFYSKGKKIYLTMKEIEILTNSNLIKS